MLWVCPWTGASQQRKLGVGSRPAAEPREEQTSRGRHLPWHKAPLARPGCNLWAEQRQEPAPASPHPLRAGRDVSERAARGRTGPRSRTSVPCQELHGKTRESKLAYRPAEPSDIETICEGFGIRERAGQAERGRGAAFPSGAEQLSSRQCPRGSGAAGGGYWSSEGCPWKHTMGISPKCWIGKLPRWFGLWLCPPACSQCTP